jgi:hypothetical protein
MRNRNPPSGAPAAGPSSGDAAAAELPRMSLGDDIRRRVAARRRGEIPDELPEVGSPFFLFSKGDFIVLLIILAVIYLIVLVEHKIDLAGIAWTRFLRPNYDHDHWD